MVDRPLTVLAIFATMPAAGMPIPQPVRALERVPEMPAPFWRAVKRVAVSCDPALSAALCALIVTEMTRRSPFPILSSDHSDNSHQARDVVKLLLSIEKAGSGRLLVGVARRAVSIDDAEGEQRVAVSLNAGARPDDAATRSAVIQLIDRVLPRPWQRPTAIRAS